jgi:hypothetical protein
MNAKPVILLFALFVVAPAAADEVTLRYALTGEFMLEMEQEIFVPGREEAIAGRSFSMGFDFAEPDEAGRQSVELTSARAHYTAHDMRQRLPASHLAGQRFALTGDGRSFQPDGPGAEIGVGPITDGALMPAGLLAGALPGLPEEPVSVGSAWIVERRLESLVGWAWAGCDMRYESEVVDIRRSGAQELVSVTTHGRATIRAAQGRSGFVGDGELDRRIEWSFDAATGQLVSYVLEQEATGTSRLPQGEVPVRQSTRIALRGP